MSYAVRFSLYYGPGFLLRPWWICMSMCAFAGGVNAQIVIQDMWAWNYLTPIGIIFNLPAALWWSRGAQVAWKRRELKR